MQIKFLGAAGTASGSRYLITTANAKILVDCGLFQGYKQLRLRNWEPLPVRPSELDAVILTHAHLGRSGYLPLLVKNGFRGKIYCSVATSDLCKMVLADSGQMMEDDAIYANSQACSRHHPALPLYTEADAARTFRFFVPQKFTCEFSVCEGLTARLLPAGYMLGAAIVMLSDGQISLCFSGDLGRVHDSIMVPPTPVAHCDYLVVESTYGDSRHDASEPMQVLGKVIRDTCERRGVMLIPACTVGGAQALLHYIYQLKLRTEIPQLLPVYLDSPLADDLTETYRKHRDEHKLTREQCEAMCHAAKMINSVQESLALDSHRSAMIIISGNEMASGGPILHHLKAFVSDPRNSVLLCGFQASGTRGAALQAGVDTLKIYGEDVPVRAQITQMHKLSAHADSEEILSWLRHFEQSPKITFISHGEPAAADALRRKINASLHWHCMVPEFMQTQTLL